MYKRISAILFPIVAIILVGTIIWGFQENRDKNTMLIKAENQYQRSFHDLSYHMDHLHTELGNALAVNSTSQGFHRKCLINAWRLTSQAQSEISQLPLVLMPLNETEEFLAKISKFSYQTAVRDLAKEPLSTKEMNTLKTLYKRSDEISKELNKIQAEVLNENLRWTDVETAMGNADQTSDNSIINGFNAVSQTVSEYDEVDWGPSITSVFETRNYEKISGKEHSAQEIKQKAVEFLNLPETTSVNVEENGSETDFKSYTVTISRSEDQGDIRMDYSKKGGHIIWLMDERKVNEKNLSFDQARQKAEKFLKDHDYDIAKAVNYNEYNNVASITMASMKDDVIIYPEKITVKVALDNGEITGLQAADYIFKHKERTIDKPVLTLSEAKKKMNPNFKVKDHSLALIENDQKQEVLCHQFIGRINGSNYRIFINATTGLEEQLEELV
jgi:spore germination protein